MSLLTVIELRKSYGSHVAVDGLSFSVEKGEVFGLLGPNGAGKSTTMMMLAGLLQPNSGTIQINGETMHPQHRELQKRLGIVPQDLAIYLEMTAGENLNFFGRLYGLRGEKLKSRMDYALEIAGLTRQRDDLAATYSGGMKRRLNFAVGLLHEPQLLILDEPTVGVDPQSRSHLLDCVRQVCAEGMSVLYASHYMEEVQAICHRVGIMDHGKMLALDTLPALLARMPEDLCLTLDLPKGYSRGKLEPLLPGDVRLETVDDHLQLIMQVTNGQGKQSLNDRLTAQLDLLKKQGVRILAIDTREPNLERLFLQLTGNRLRD